MFPILRSFNRPTALIGGILVATILFGANYYLMSNMLGVSENACVIGGALNFSNISFTVLTSVMSGLLVSGVIELASRSGMRKALSVSPVAGGGFALGSFTVFCTSCVLPAVSILGASVGLDFFNEYNPLLKVLSILLLMWGLYLVNKKLSGSCEVCKQ